MKVLINHNLCDEAPECGGIEVCPTGAFHYDYKRKRVAIDESKCTLCLKCTLPDACPVGCILFARSIGDEKKIRSMIKEDPRTAKWLWRERFGCQPGKAAPRATIVNPSNFNTVLMQKGYKLIDIWHPDYLDCRINSALFSDLLKGLKEKVAIQKLDASEFPKLAKKLNVDKFPSLLLFKDGNELSRFSGLIEPEKVKEINKKIKSILQ